MSGLWAERIACLWLIVAGWQVVARRLAGFKRSGIGEVDLIVKRRGVLAFVEVKYRPSLAAAAAAVSLNQRRRIVRAARAFLSAHPDYGAYTVRFDAVLIAPWTWPRHVVNAWNGAEPDKGA